MKSPPSAPRRILLTCPQRLGDVLLATALIRSLKQTWPASAIDVIVLRGTEGVLEGNPDIRAVIGQRQRASIWHKLGEAIRLWRRYDLAVAAMPTDRSRLYAWIGGRFRVGFLTSQAGEKGKAGLLDRHVMFDDLDTHTVAMQAQLALLAGAKPSCEVVPPQLAPEDEVAFVATLPTQPYAVLHPCPKFRYKMWRPEAWCELAEYLQQRGLHIVFSGSGDVDELAYVDAIASRFAGPRLNLAGKVSLAESASVLRGAALYVGPDTVMTHMAAACGIPTLALFGPSNPVKWGPWPAGWEELQSPWARVGSGRQGNVLLLQGVADCVPCMLEGCDRHERSPSACLEEMPVRRVIDAVEELLGR